MCARALERSILLFDNFQRIILSYLCIYLFIKLAVKQNETGPNNKPS